jgi:putative acetyltransferase
MKAKHRLATLGDAKLLFELRRKSITTLAPSGMSVSEADTWAATLTIAGMELKIHELEIWIAELDDTVVGWGAIHDDRLEGLYADPEFAGQGIGTELLSMLEGLLRDRGIRAVHANASANAETFYIRRGYEPVGPWTPDGGRPIMKRLT